MCSLLLSLARPLLAPLISYHVPELCFKPHPQVRDSHLKFKQLRQLLRQGKTETITSDFQRLTFTASRLTAMASPNSHDRPFPFLRLPAEMRNKIYGLLLKSAVQYMPNLGPPRALYRQGSCVRHTGLCPALLSTCKRVLAEAGGILYQNELFFLHLADFSDFIDSVGPENAELVMAIAVPFSNISHTLQVADSADLLKAKNLKAIYIEEYFTKKDGLGLTAGLFKTLVTTMIMPRYNMVAGKTTTQRPGVVGLFRLRKVFLGGVSVSGDQLNMLPFALFNERSSRGTASQTF